MNDNLLPAVATLLMAGGDGSRIGGAKPKRRLNGRRLVDFVLEIADAVGGPVAIGVRRKDQLADCGEVAFVLDAMGAEGPVASLAAGLQWAQAHGAIFLLTLPCDAPFLPRDLAGRLFSRIEADAANVALPRSFGWLHPSCGLWRASVLSRLHAYFATGGRSLIGFAEHVGYATEDWGAPERDPFFNVNTPEDLAQACSRLAHPHLE